MGLQLVTGPAREPVSLIEAKEHSDITYSDRDGLLAGILLAARKHAETYTRRAFIAQTFALTIDDDWPTERVRSGCLRDRIVLPRPPLISVSSIEYVDQGGTTQTLLPNQYQVAKLNTGEWAIDPAYGVVWPAVRKQAAAITVTFVAGYGEQPGDVEEPIRQAIKLIFGHWVENKEAVNVGNIVTEYPLGVEALLGPYRVYY